MPNYMDRERQRTDEWRDEMLDWMHLQHKEQVEQTALLERISRHTGLLYVVLIIWLVLVGIGLLALFFGAASGSRF